MAIGTDPYELSQRAVQTVAEQLRSFRVRWEKRTPAWVEYLGWCTWDAFYGKVDARKVLAGLESFRRGGLVPRFVLLDVHAEATSEKVALGWYLDGKASAILGTHTHVPTADERVLPGGSAYVTDVGMTGPYDSVIGMEKEPVLAHFLTGLHHRFHPAARDVRLQSVLVDLDEETGFARSIRRVERRLEDGTKS